MHLALVGGRQERGVEDVLRLGLGLEGVDQPDLIDRVPEPRVVDGAIAVGFTSGVTMLSRMAMRSRSSSTSFFRASSRRTTASTASTGRLTMSFRPLRKACRNALTASGFSAANLGLMMMALP